MKLHLRLVSCSKFPDSIDVIVDMLGTRIHASPFDEEDTCIVILRYESRCLGAPTWLSELWLRRQSGYKTEVGGVSRAKMQIDEKLNARDWIAEREGARLPYSTLTC